VKIIDDAGLDQTRRGLGIERRRLDADAAMQDLVCPRRRGGPEGDSGQDHGV
jgi:hypothetical protein